MMNTNSKKAFSMLTALVVIVTMAVIAAYVTSTAGKSIKITTDEYRKEQAMLYAKSYTEYAIMAVSADVSRATGGTCLRDINANIGSGTNAFSANRGRGPGYEINIRILYIGSNNQVGSCANNRRLNNNVQTPGTPLNIIVDAYVKYNDLNDNRPDKKEERHFTYHRRSLQKI